MKSVQTYKKIFSSPIFVISLFLVALNSHFLTSDMLEQANVQLSRYDAQSLTFQIFFTSITREVIPVSVGLILAWLLVINCQYKIRKEQKDILGSFNAHLVFVFSLIATGTIISLFLGYIRVGSFGNNFEVQISDILVPIMKGLLFSSTIFLFRRLQMKYAYINKNIIFTICACVALIFANSCLIIFADYLITHMFI